MPASNTELEARTAALETSFQNQQADTVAISALTPTQRKLVIDSLYPNGVWVNINENLADMSGMTVFGKGTGARAGINNGELVLGWKVKASTPNPTSDSDFETPYGYSQ